MLDNFTPKKVKEAIKRLNAEGVRDKLLIEASGGISERNLLEFASAGVDIISLGILTHDVKALDLSMEIKKLKT